MVLCRKIRAECNFVTLKNFMISLKTGLFCKMVILVTFCKNLIC